MVVSLRKRSLQCMCNSVGMYSDSTLSALPLFLKNQMLQLLSRRSSEKSAGAVRLLVNSTTLEVNWSGFDEIGDASAESVQRCASLQKLNFNAIKGERRCPSAASLSSMFRCLPRLRDVQLRRCRGVDDSVVDVLTQTAPHLLVLNLSGCGCTDAGVKLVAQRCRRLTSLNLSDTQVTDAGVADIADSPAAKQLTELQINSCRLLTDASIRLLVESCPRLRILTFTNCPRLTEESRLAISRLESRGNMQQLFWTVY